MAETTKERLAAVEQEREAYYQEHKSDLDFVALMKQKAVLNKKGIAIVVACAAVVMLAATWALPMILEKPSPMWMWLTGGLPAIAASVYVMVTFGLHEKYTDYAKEVERGVAEVTAKLFDYDREIDRLQAEVGTEEAEIAEKPAEAEEAE